MRRIIFTFLIVSCAGFIFSQTFYWAVYDMKITTGQEAKVLSAIDKFMKTDHGKSMPSMAVSALLFKDSREKATHRLVFFTDDKSKLGNMYSGALQQTTEFQLMDAQIGEGMHNVGSALGRSLYATPPGPDNYEGVLEMNITDPGKYLEAFKIFSDGVYAKYSGKVVMSLHRVFSGQEPGVTHAVVLGADSFDTFLTFTDEIYQSDLFKTLNNEVKDIRKVKSNTTSITLARYNMPEEQ